MVWWRHNVLETGKTISNDADTTIDLAGTGILNALQLFFTHRPESAATTTHGQRELTDHLTEINILGDGKETILSLSGEELAACAIWDLGKWYTEMANNYGNKYCRTEMPIFFGRFWKDKLMGLDKSKFTTLDLVLTFDDWDTSHWIASPDVRVSELFMEDAPGVPRNYIRKVEQKKESPSAAGQWVRYTVPETLTLKRLLFLIDSDLAQVGSATTYPTGGSNAFTFSFQDRKVKMFDSLTPKEMFRINSHKYGNFTRVFSQRLYDTLYYDTQLGYVLGAAVMAVTEGTGADTQPPAMEDSQDRYQTHKHEGNADHYRFNITGRGPFTSWVIDFGEGDPADYLRVKDKAPIKIDWYGASADHKFRYVTEELHSN